MHTITIKHKTQELKFKTFIMRFIMYFLVIVAVIIICRCSLSFFVHVKLLYNSMIGLDWIMCLFTIQKERKYFQWVARSSYLVVLMLNGQRNEAISTMSKQICLVLVTLNHLSIMKIRFFFILRASYFYSMLGLRYFNAIYVNP